MVMYMVGNIWGFEIKNSIVRNGCNFSLGDISCDSDKGGGWVRIEQI